MRIDRKLNAAFLFCLALVPAAFAAPGATFVGQLEKRLVAGSGKPTVVVLTPMAAGSAPVPLAAGERAFAGSAPPWREADPLSLVLIESAQGHARALFYDRNRDGELAPDERASFPQVVPEPADLAIDLELPLETGPFPKYPLRFGRFQGKVGGLGVTEDSKFFTLSKTAYVPGKVEVDGRQVAVRYTFTPGEELDPRAIEQGVDVDGDGVFGGPQTAEADGGMAGQSGAPLFPVGSHFLSTRKIDLASGRIEMVSHPASDYRRVLLSPGSQLPDFAFTDYAGQPHKLSELRGKYVLLDFWATWCAPCIAAFPTLKEIYAESRSRGLEIVTIAWKDSKEKAGRLVEKEQLPWLQGTAESTLDLATRDLRLQSVPFTLLLDPQGRIVSTGARGQPELRGGGLKETIANLLPKAATPVDGR